MLYTALKISSLNQQWYYYSNRSSKLRWGLPVAIDKEGGVVERGVDTGRDGWRGRVRGELEGHRRVATKKSGNDRDLHLLRIGCFPANCALEGLFAELLLQLLLLLK